MILTVSPAKTLNIDPQTQTKKHTVPDFLDRSELLIARMRKLSKSQIATLMGISDKLAAGVAEYVARWNTPFDASNAKQAVLTFMGDVYDGLDASDFKARDFDFAQKHLRILSGLYGLLRPLDLMQPYRLEMGCPLQNRTGRKAVQFTGLYDFWGDTITEALNQSLAAARSDMLVNLASAEYFKAVRRDALAATVITPVFKNEKNGKYKVISFFAKKARGRMARFVIKNRIDSPADIKKFDLDGYQFDAGMSSESEWVFTRPER
jgi:hypothetical protein